jgi:hypothetical protein
MALALEALPLDGTTSSAIWPLSAHAGIRGEHHSNVTKDAITKSMMEILSRRRFGGTL